MPTCRLPTLFLVPCLAIALLSACQKSEPAKRAGPPPVQITVTPARTGEMILTEETLGSLEAVEDPKIGAEVSGKVIEVLVGPGQAVRRGDLLAILDDADYRLQSRVDEAEHKRTEALLAQQERVLERQRQLVEKGFISQNAVDDALAQRDALREQLRSASARGELSRRSQGKARVVAPFDGSIEAQLVSAGDFVKVGDPLFQLVSKQKLRAHLPFPESAAQVLKPGQPIRLVSALQPGQVYAGTISEIRPAIAAASRALDVIVEIDNRNGLRPGATVDAVVEIGRRDNAILVPEQSVVLRPAGKVVYAIAEGKAVQKIVQVGARRDGWVEIREGLAAATPVAVDGAGFLSDGAAVAVQEKKAKEMTAGTEAAAEAEKETSPEAGSAGAPMNSQPQQDGARKD